MMYKLFLTTATVALFSMTACDSASKEKTSADSKVESKKDASSEEAKTKDSKVDAKTDSKPTALPTSLDTPDELKPEKVEKFGDKEIADIERAIFNMLKRDPQKFMEIVQMAGQFQQAKQDLEVRQLLEANKDKLLKEDNAIVTGNTKGTVNFILIEDPLCPNCRTLDGILGNVMKKQPSLKVIKHQWAFLEGGEPSSFVARHFQAAYKSDKTKFNSLQKAFLMLQEPPTEEKLHALIKGAGYDVEKIKSSADSAEAKTNIEDVRNLAKSIKLPGAPVLMALAPNGELVALPVNLTEEQLNKVVVDLSKAPAANGKKEDTSASKEEAKSPEKAAAAAA